MSSMYTLISRCSQNKMVASSPNTCSWPHINQALATAMDETEKAYMSMEKSATTIIFPHDGENE